MEFYWERWETTEHHANDCPEKDLLRIIDSGLDRRCAKELFLGLWKYWWSKFPNACILVTMTQNHFNHNRQELRFWFGEPDSFRHGDHVDSFGHHLIATVRGPDNQLLRLVAKMLPTEEFEEGFVRPPSDAVKHHTAPSSTVTWRRKANL